MKTLFVCLLAVAALAADVRVSIRLGAGHPIRRARTVVVHRAPVVVAPRVVYAPPVLWTRAAVALPPRDRLVWEDSETMQRREDWVDTFFSVNNTGDALLLQVKGRAQIDFAEVHFRNGGVQVVDFHEADLRNGIFPLHNFADGRYVEHVRMVARAMSPRVTLTVVMKK